MNKKIWQRILSFLLVCIIVTGSVYKTVDASVVKEAVNGVATETFDEGKMKEISSSVMEFITGSKARKHVFLAYLYDENSMSYIPTVMYVNSEVERSRIQFLYQMDVASFKTLNGSMVTTGSGLPAGADSYKNNIKLTKSGWGVEAKTIPEDKIEEFMKGLEDNPDNRSGVAPLSFPGGTGNKAGEADTNRAYKVAETLGNGFMDALLFINNGHSYADIGNRDYFLEMRYLLLSGMTNNPTPVKIVNSYGYEYEVSYDVPQNGQVTIKQIGHYKELVDGTNYENSNGSVHYAYKGQDKWKKDSFVTESNPKKEVFYYKLKKGYVKKTETFEDGSVNNLIGCSAAAEIDYINWTHLVLNADLLYTQGIDYNTSGDLYTKTVVETAITDTFSGLLNGLKSLLGLHSISELVFSDGNYDTDAYVYGTFPTTWLPNMMTFYLIMSVIAFSVVIIAVLVQIYKYGLVKDGRVGTRYGIVMMFKDLLTATLGVAFFIPIFLIFLRLNSLIVAIFRDIAQMNPRGMNAIFSDKSYNLLAGLLLNFGKLIICAYINIIYIIRMITIVGLFCFAPIFIIAAAFGIKGKQMTMAWLRELVGNVVIQAVHAGVFALLITVCVGLREIEALTMLACIIPLTNMFRGLITQGGQSTGSLASKLTGMGVAGTAGAIGLASKGVEKASSILPSGFGQAVSTAGKATSGLASFGLGAGAALALDTQPGQGMAIASSGVKQIEEAGREAEEKMRESDANSPNPRSAGETTNGQYSQSGRDIPYASNPNMVGKTPYNPNSKSGDKTLSNTFFGGSKNFGDDDFTPFSSGQVATTEGGTSVSSHDFAFGNLDSLSVRDGNLYGKVSIDKNSSEAQIANFNKIIDPYDKAVATCDANGIKGDHRTAYINSQTAQYGVTSFRTTKRGGSVAEFTMAAPQGLTSAKATTGGQAQFIFGGDTTTMA